MKKEEYETFSASQTSDIGKKFSEKIIFGRVIALRGGLGAGKTCFVTGFAEGMGYTGEVSSPTFSIVNEYRGGRLEIYHYDMYRVNGWEDLYTTGYFENIDSGGVVLVEWSENIEAALPDDAIYISIKETEQGSRIITIEEE